MTDAHTSESVAAQLTRARECILPPLREAVNRLHPHLAHVCGYHFGWWSADGEPSENAVPSKFLRATLTLLAAEAVGESPHTAVPGAVAVELLHNHSLLHDDVIDQDDLRRGRRTVWSAYGTGTAVLAGDALAALSVSHLSRVGTTPAKRALVMLLNAFQCICAGQAADLELERGRAVTVEDYLQMAADKTSALLACAAGIGAVLCGADEATIVRLQAACTDLGLAWQAANDVEDIWGDPAVTGKPRLSDLRQGKTTLPVLAALASNTPAGRELAACRTSTTGPNPEDLEHIADLIVRAGGRAATERLALNKLNSAEAHLRKLHVPEPSRHTLTALFRFIVTRSA
ncbi:polyprenyl synthetase family protein [Streptomyces sp. SYP-A7193]|uniref:polyprenyl synthetase family protein n=1 Tax=Streptomyces sp. SYP-A7193 TaxID=2662065 RepID=UPI001291191C|nr:polyprenyl synthetase family protein [Streptomyces sp. SYP-A7193]QFX80089.1 polyprenyl synthetase family protein [Streptomyces sp. SYP-A7193]